MLEQESDASGLSSDQYKQLLELACKMEDEEGLAMECDSNMKLLEDLSNSLSFAQDIILANDEARPTKDSENQDGYSEGRWTDEEHEKFLVGKKYGS